MEWEVRDLIQLTLENIILSLDFFSLKPNT